MTDIKCAVSGKQNRGIQLYRIESKKSRELCKSITIGLFRLSCIERNRGEEGSWGKGVISLFFYSCVISGWHN